MMDSIKRYRLGQEENDFGLMRYDQDGEYVTYSDYENRLCDLMNDLAEIANKPDQSKIIKSLEDENSILRDEIKQIREITEIKGCYCKRKFVKQIPSLVLNENLILKQKHD